MGADSKVNMEIMLLALAALGAVTALPLDAPICDFSQIPGNPLYSDPSQKSSFGAEFCDANHAGNPAGFYPCGGEQPNGEVFPACKITFNELEGCGSNYAPHSDCKFGDSFLGKIGCKYSNAGHSMLLPDDQQPVTCKESYNWCCPCGYNNAGNAARTCGSISSKQEAWSGEFSQEKLLPAGDPSALTLEQVQSWGWYSSQQLYKYCNVAGKCIDLVKDDPYSTAGGCATQIKDPSPCKQYDPTPTPPTPPAPPAPPTPPSCPWQTAAVACSADADCAAWVTKNCPAGLSQKYCKANGSCHFSA